VVLLSLPLLIRLPVLKRRFNINNNNNREVIASIVVVVHYSSCSLYRSDSMATGSSGCSCGSGGRVVVMVEW
jgi:hypothetical protein